MKFKRVLIFALIALPLSYLAMFSPPYLERGAFFIYDFLQNHTSAIHQNEVRLIYLDQQSIDQMSKADGLNFPWPREYYGVINAMAKKLKAKLIFYDMLYTEPSSYGRQDDDNFASMIEDSKVPTFFPAPDYSGTVKPPIPSIMKVSTGLGGVHLTSSSDGVYREVLPYLKGKGGKRVRSMPFVLADFLGVSTSESGHHRLLFYKNTIQATPFYNLLVGYKNMEHGGDLSDLSLLKDKIWMVGASAPGLRDLRPTPIDPKTPGVYVHATSLLNLIRGDHITVIEGGPLFWISFILSLFIIVVSLYIKRPCANISFSVGLVFVPPLIFTFIGWYLAHIWINPLVLIATLFVMMIILLSYRFQLDWIAQIRISKSLEHSMSSEMLELVKQGGIDSLNFIEHRKVTILFSDIVSFTDISEKISADKLANLLNRYFDEVVSLIFDNHGYVDKFIGDAVMAVWGGPLIQKDHAQFAVQTARKYNQCLIKFNKKMREEDPSGPEIVARVGVHCGEVVAGNIGSSKRFNYTFIGDSVNLASRLEGICKQYHLFLLISGETVEEAGLWNDPALILVDRIAVKGKEQATAVYTFLSESDLKDKENFKAGLKFYQNASFDDALTHFSQCESFPAAEIFKERCEDILQNGIPKNYLNGVWNYETK